MCKPYNCTCLWAFDSYYEVGADLIWSPANDILSHSSDIPIPFKETHIPSNGIANLSSNILSPFNDIYFPSIDIKNPSSDIHLKFF